jgi:hypothetical protein
MNWNGEKKAADNHSGQPHHGQENDFLTAREIDRLIVAASVGWVPQPMTEQDAGSVVEWARRVRIDQALLAVVLDGSTVPAGMKDGQLSFTPVSMLPKPQADALRAKLEEVDKMYASMAEGRGA